MNEALERRWARLEQLKGSYTRLSEDQLGELRFRAAHRSAALEGNTLTLQEVKTVVRKGSSQVPNKTDVEKREVRNLAQAILFVNHQAGKVWNSGTAPKNKNR